MESVMRIAVDNGMPSIDGGSGCSCATHRVFVDGTYLEVLRVPDSGEETMLDINQRTHAQLATFVPGRLKRRVRRSDRADPRVSILRSGAHD